jgi:hypothetical protein
LYRENPDTISIHLKPMDSLSAKANPYHIKGNSHFLGQERSIKINLSKAEGNIYSDRTPPHFQTEHVKGVTMSLFNKILEKLGLRKGETGAQSSSQVDVVEQLEQKAKGTGLNWKSSIVDLLTLLGLESSREARNELAKELDCPEEFMSDSAKMNTWLHKTVMKKIADNGGNIPKELMD